MNPAAAMRPFVVLTHLAIAAACIWGGMHLASTPPAHGEPAASATSYDQPATQAQTSSPASAPVTVSAGHIPRLRQFLADLDKTDATSLPDAWNKCVIQPASIRNLGQRLLLKRFADTEPEICRSLAGETLWQSEMEYRKLTALMNDPKALSAYIKTQGNRCDLALDNALQRLVEQASEHILGLYEAHDLPQPLIDRLLKNSDRIQSRYPEQILTAALKNMNPEVTRSTLARLHEQDPEAFEAWVAAHGAIGDKFRQEALAESRAFLDQAASDPAAALTTLGEAPGASTVLAEWIARDPAAARDWIATLAASNPLHAARLVKRATEAGDHIPPSPANLTNLASIVSLIPNGEARARAVSNIASQWANIDPDAARSWLHTLPTGKAKSDAIKELATAIHGNASGEQILKQIEAYPGLTRMMTDSYKLNYTRMIAQDPEQGPAYARAIFEHAPEEDKAEQVVDLIRGCYEGANPERARQLAESIPGDNGIAARGTYANQLGDDDPVAAVAYAAGLPEGESRNAVAISLLEKSFERKPAAAIDALGLISPDKHPGACERLLLAIYRSNSTRDRSADAALSARIRTLDIPEKSRDTLLRALAQRQE